MAPEYGPTAASSRVDARRCATAPDGAGRAGRLVERYTKEQGLFA